jgi:hypothetical protein
MSEKYFSMMIKDIGFGKSLIALRSESWGLLGMLEYWYGSFWKLSSFKLRSFSEFDGARELNEDPGVVSEQWRWWVLGFEIIKGLGLFT